MKQKAALQKHSVLVKTQQKEVHTATLELGASNFQKYMFDGGSCGSNH